MKTESTTQRFHVGPSGLLTVDACEGSIIVRAADDDEIEVVIKRWGEKKGGDVMKALGVELTRDGDDVRITQSGWSQEQNAHMELSISVPSRYAVDLKTAGGGIVVVGLEGEVNCRTIGGGIEVKDVAGDVIANTSGGSINISRVRGNVTARTSGSGISAEGVEGALDAATSGGGVVVRFPSQIHGDCFLTTAGADVEAHLSADIKTNLDAEASAGLVISDFAVGVEDDAPSYSLRASVNGGGPALVCRTIGANVYLRKI